MRRDRIMNQSANSLLCQLLLNGIAARMFDDIEMPDGLSPRGYEGKSQIMRFRQRLLVTLGDHSPTPVPLVEFLELDAKERGLQLVQPRVVAVHIVVIFLFRAVIA